MGTPKVLIIDDEPAVQKAMEKALKGENYDVVFASNGLEGLQKLEKEKPDLVFLDLRMPKLDGLMFLEKTDIQPDDPYCVIVITGHGNDREVEKSFELGVNFFLHKPLSIVEVRCLANRCLDMKAIEKELREHKTSLEKIVNQRTKALRDQILFQQNLIDSIPVPIYYKDVKLKYLGCNRAFEETLGLNKEQIIGKSVHDIMPEKLASTHHHKDMQLISTGEVRHYEVTAEYPDGQEHDLLVFKALFHNSDGSIGGLIGTHMDITERKQVQLQLELHAEELKNANTALRVLLQQVKESKSDMEDKILDNLGRLVNPYLEILDIDLAHTRHHEYVRMIQENINKITSAFSQKLSSSFLGLSPREIQIADLVRHGRTNKETSGILNISVNAVEFHRNNLRKKLGIQNKKVNLRTYLLSMD
jgi:PAS domain S-box-containing protein